MCTAARTRQPRPWTNVLARLDLGLIQRSIAPAVISYMRASRRLAQLAVVAATLGVAGCGVSSAPSTPHVGLNISAPTSGASVGVHQVTVMGTVSPLTAAVTVNGRPAHVAGGVYKQTLWVSSQNQKISVAAAAHGYTPANATTTISYSPTTAAQLAAAAATLKPAPASAQSHVSRSTTSAINAMFNLTSPSSGSKSHGKSGSVTATPTPPSSSGSTGTGTTPTTPSGGAGAGTGGGTSSAPTTPPPPTPAQIAAAIRKAWINGCIPHTKVQNVAPYCTCTYTQLQKDGNNILSTRQGVNKWNRDLKPYLRTGDITKLPRFAQRAVLACINKYPPPDPIKGRPTLKPLAGANHPGQGPSNQPVNPLPSSPSSPSSPTTPGTTTGTTTGSTTGTSSPTGTTGLGYRQTGTPGPG